MDKNYTDISIEGFLPVENAGPYGSPIEMRWIDITQLKVDKRYQRNISKGGKGNVRQIALRFNWNKFTPVIVCPIEENFYAIVDGQHRTTGAALIGIKSVPCSIIEPLSLAEQANSYKAINTNVTRITPQDMHFADLAAGDPLAVTIDEICTKVGIKIVKSSLNRQLKPNECQAIGAFKALVRDNERDIVIQTLVCILRKSQGNAGLLRPELMKALSTLFAINKRWVGHPKLFNALDYVNFSSLLIQATTMFMETRRPRNQCLLDLLEKKFVQLLDR